MSKKIALWVLIGIIIGTMSFPWISIPLMGIGIVIGAIFVMIHDVIMPGLHLHNHEHSHNH